MEILTGIMIAVLIFYSGKLIIGEELAINKFFSFLAAMMLAYQPVKTLAKVNISINQGLAAAERIIPIIDQKNEINLNEKDQNISISKANIIFKNINFAYQSNIEKQILNDISVEFKGGEMTALVGLSGSGKSTLLNLVPRIYVPTSGSIELDNQDISKINLNSLRKEISIVDQNTTLFDDTVFNNIIYAKPDAASEEVFKAAESAMCNDFISNLDKGFNTLIGENGVKLSGVKNKDYQLQEPF